MKITLEAGKLYQVKHDTKGWVIAEYVREVPAHSYKYHNISMHTLTVVGTERTRHVPLSHQWKWVRAHSYNATFTLEAKGMEVRPVTAEALETIAKLRAEITRLGEEQRERIKELKEFCE